MQPRRQPGGPEAHRRGYLQPAGWLFLAFGQQCLGDCQLGEDLTHRPVQCLALFSQDQAAGVAVEQRNLKRFLQCRDLARNGRLAQAERVSGMREAACLRHGVEHTQLVPVHQKPLPAAD